MGLQAVVNTAHLPRACTSMWPTHRGTAASCHSLKSGSRYLEERRVFGHSFRRHLKMSSSAEGWGRGAPLSAKHHKPSTNDGTSIRDACRRSAGSSSEANDSEDVDVPAMLAMTICSLAAVVAPLTISLSAIAASDFSITPSHYAAASGNPIAEVSGLFGLGSSDREDDPVDPFTLYGAV